jgi:hypothetical protein
MPKVLPTTYPPIPKICKTGRVYCRVAQICALIKIDRKYRTPPRNQTAQPVRVKPNQRASEKDKPKNTLPTTKKTSPATANCTEFISPVPIWMKVNTATKAQQIGVIRLDYACTPHCCTWRPPVQLLALGLQRVCCDQGLH